MTIVFKGHDYAYEVRNVALLFFQGEPITEASELPEQGDYLFTELQRDGSSAKLTLTVRLNGIVHSSYAEVPLDVRAFDKECERVFGIMMYRLLSPLTGVTPQWGILTGIRPVTLVHKLKAQGLSEQQIVKHFEESYLVSPRKASLLLRTAGKEAAIIQTSAPNSFSLYISIPFCPTRCHYCSFVSHAIEKSAGLIEAYLPKLCEEIALTGEIAGGLKLRLETVYIGGGTPTTLSAQGLITLFAAIRNAFDLSTLREYTVEAGRPDTITEEKLIAIRESEATRISINPQTFNNHVLEAIGRRHTAQQTIDSFNLARRVGINCINMDLIAGLPTDTLESFQNSVDTCIRLSPEDVTVHTLSLKRSSNLAYNKAAEQGAREGMVTAMTDYAETMLQGAGYNPYYLYRQRNTRENLENTGFAKEGYEGLYNVFIMDETHTILACGAGGVTKLREPSGSRIERIFNYKYPHEYISGFDEILSRKRQVEDFYDGCVL
ncbi:coproporphyrinogen dehydrogenase HemZ [Acetanaerobacterium elongatum]|uniref:Oxygen-independent coproporphyrinogen-3 oxidase n=1 Tax=Acetanaerobacterium elongatum TaxID=258515 RepID=A0A1H0A699_9FIRM|nr:coproporphyrinogen dehydrogenase HemZ [Acetanaerobacterium elongatum]SDN29322.1 oxygen-independent coproporphyrinogen-3 oxidase [Acetanaerobacterium elongatum]